MRCSARSRRATPRNPIAWTGWIRSRIFARDGGSLCIRCLVISASVEVISDWSWCGCLSTWRHSVLNRDTIKMGYQMLIESAALRRAKGQQNAVPLLPGPLPSNISSTVTDYHVSHYTLLHRDRTVLSGLEGFSITNSSRNNNSINTPAYVSAGAERLPHKLLFWRRASHSFLHKGLNPLLLEVVHSITSSGRQGV
jgi:hypothetical protein